MWWVGILFIKTHKSHRLVKFIHKKHNGTPISIATNIVVVAWQHVALHISVAIVCIFPRLSHWHIGQSCDWPGAQEADLKDVGKTNIFKMERETQFIHLFDNNIWHIAQLCCESLCNYQWRTAIWTGSMKEGVFSNNCYTLHIFEHIYNSYCITKYIQSLKCRKSMSYMITYMVCRSSVVDLWFTDLDYLSWSQVCA